MIRKLSVVLCAVCALTSMIGTAASADQVASPAGGVAHRYSEAELNAKDRGGLIDLLAGLPKKQLVDLVLREQQSEDAAVADGGIVNTTHDDTRTVRKHGMNLWLPLVGMAAGSFAFASLSRSGHQGFPTMTNTNVARAVGTIAPSWRIIPSISSVNVGIKQFL